ncbi:MAG: protoporphyrinogen oxidase [Bacteroidetes bacterium SB0662_bin_6]|nr:protoporphyrinogen oxidase [Bacteroidetes bacterium SB0668_bin_1]MYE03462.1 protoporphyrinogen oxidase [Bacteroidetes bacterium SB0662_bin_6]
MRVAVIGAGIAGLTAAFRLRLAGEEPVVFEAQAQTGGVIGTERIEGFLVEFGPTTIQAANPVLDVLIRDTGLEPDRLPASKTARKRYIVRDGKPVAAPNSPADLVTNSLFSARAQRRALREPLIPRSRPTEEESVADFARRRFGPEALDYGMDPLVAGVYGGDPKRLAIRHAFPGIWRMEQESGSIVRALLRGRKDKKSRMASGMFSFRKGLGQLPEALSDALGDRLRLSTPVRRLERQGARWIVSGDCLLGGHEQTAWSESFDAVVYAAPLHALASIALPEGPSLKPLTNVVYAPLVVTAMGFRREHVGHPLDGFGMLVPGVERSIRILGTLFTSSIFSGISSASSTFQSDIARAPAGHVLLTTIIGGMRNPALASLPEKEAYDLVLGDLRRLLDISGEPVFRWHTSWKLAVPQYNIGYGKTLAAIERLEASWPGWFMAGNYRMGVSIGDAAKSGEEAARRCLL